MLKGIVLSIGGTVWALLHIWDWLNWRSGKPTWLPWLRWPEGTRTPPQTDMNRIVESANAVGNGILGLVLALLGLAIIANS